jgi:hypothetical protein
VTVGWARVRSIRHVVAACVLLGAMVVGVRAGALQHPHTTVPGNCQTVGATRTAFPAAGRWTTVNRQTFNGSSLPPLWDPFSGYYDGGTGQPRHSIREPALLSFPGPWMEYRNYVYSDNDQSGNADVDADGDGGTDSSFYTIADAGASEVYPATYDPGTGTTLEGYDVNAHPWGFQWCARFNGSGGFDTAFAFVPTDGAWPPEIDFIEHGPHQGNTVTIHIHWKATRYNDGHPCDPQYPATNSQNCHANFPSIPVTVGHWNAYAVTWSANEIDVWIDGRRINAFTVTPRICTQRADQPDGFGDTGRERLCLPNGYVGNNPANALEPYVWDMQVNSYNGVTHYAGDQTDLAWFEALRP